MNIKGSCIIEKATHHESQKSYLEFPVRQLCSRVLLSFTIFYCLCDAGKGPCEPWAESFKCGKLPELSKFYECKESSELLPLRENFPFRKNSIQHPSLELFDSSLPTSRMFMSFGGPDKEISLCSSSYGLAFIIPPATAATVNFSSLSSSDCLKSFPLWLRFDSHSHLWSQTQHLKACSL